MPMNRNLKSLERINSYQKEQLEYIQGQINKVRNSIEDRQSLEWQTVNEVYVRKSTSN